jgi:prolyl-tRNA editing enzyme YbaK/EbsC (Cys-tRNA(Pro) deacylase)
MSMSIDRVRTHFSRWNMQDRIMEFDQSSATVELAALAVGCVPARIAKTLSFLVDGSAVLIAVAGDAKVDNARFKSQFHTKAKMLTPDEAVALVGHAVGGVCPFAVNEGVKVYLDESLKRFETVFPAAGSSNSAIELTLPELEQTSGGTWVDVCKAWRDGE